MGMPQDSDPQRNGELLIDLLDMESDSPAIVCPDDDSAVSYQQLAETATRIAGLLRSVGVERGSRVALVLANGPEIVEMVLAITLLGAAAAPLNPAYTASEYAFYLGDLDPELLLVPAGEYPNVRQGAASSVRAVDVELLADGPPRLHLAGSEIRKQASFEPAEADDVALLLHTSGTTSRPKQVPLRQRNLAYSARSIAAGYGLTGADSSYCAMPLFHVHGLVASTLATLASGGTVIIPRRYTSHGFWTQAAKHSATWFSAGPTTHQMALNAREDHAAPDTLRFVRSCSSALSPTLLAEAEDAYRAPVLEAYGMTEASHQMASNPLPPRAHVPGSVGISAGAELRIVGPAGRDVPTGEPGEVAVRGPGITSGYLNNPTANAEAFVDGWFRTGDRGLLADGYLYLQGRLKEMILRGGENISPYEIEEVLLSHPAVADAACFGVEDPKYGEVVGAAVALAADAEPSDIADHCREHLAAFKVPTVIHVLDSIPRTPTGKVPRKQIATMVAGDP